MVFENPLGMILNAPQKMTLNTPRIFMPLNDTPVSTIQGHRNTGGIQVHSTIQDQYYKKSAGYVLYLEWQDMRADAGAMPYRGVAPKG